MPSSARRLGHSGDLLFESAVARAAIDPVDSIPGVQYLGVMANAPTVDVLGLRDTLCWCVDLVDQHQAVP